MGAYNKWYIVDLVVSDQASNETDVDYIEEVQETILDSISSVFAEQIVISNYGAFQIDDVVTSGYYIVQWSSMAYVLAEPYGEVFKSIGSKYFWYHDPPTTLPVMVKMKQVIHANLTCTGITAIKWLPHRMWGYKDLSPRLLIESHHDLMLQQIACREVLEYREDTYGIDRTFKYKCDNIDGDNFD
eukprot:scaffold420461_cov35-Attheya_sp.AAC.1